MPVKSEKYLCGRGGGSDRAHSRCQHADTVVTHLTRQLQRRRPVHVGYIGVVLAGR